MNFSGKKILVTGGTGFLGSHVCRGLVDCGASVILMDLAVEANRGRIRDFYHKVQAWEGDILDAGLVEKAASGVDAVIHTAFPAAACGRSPDKQFAAAGTEGTLNALKAAWKQNAVFVYASSISVYGFQRYLPIDEEHPVQPFLLYGATKLAGEHYCRIMAGEYGAKAVILRFSDFYGPDNGRNSAPNAFLENALQGKSLVVRGGGHQVRTYLFISDAVRAVLLAVKRGGDVAGKVFNIGGRESVSIKEMAERVRGITPGGVDIIEEPAGPDPRCYCISSAKAQRELGYEPRVTLDEGLRLTASWIKNEEPERFRLD